MSSAADVTGGASAAFMRDVRRLQEELALSPREARGEAELLLMHALGISRAQLIAHPEHAAAASGNARYATLLQRRLDGEPIAYLLGRREFYGLEFEVSPAVLIPRPETELLVDLALERLPPDASGCVADVGTGSGCVAVAIARARPHLMVIASDLSAAAVELADRNAARLGVRNLRLIQGDWVDAFAPGRLRMVVSNPPYIREDDPHLPALRHEPPGALIAGADGLDAWRAIVQKASRCLVPQGWLLMEHGYDQAEACAALLHTCRFEAVISAHDLAGHARVTGGMAGHPD